MKKFAKMYLRGLFYFIAMIAITLIVFEVPTIIYRYNKIVAIIYAVVVSATTLGLFLSYSNIKESKIENDEKVKDRNITITETDEGITLDSHGFQPFEASVLMARSYIITAQKFLTDDEIVNSVARIIEFESNGDNEDE